MPIYTYICNECGEKFDVLVGVTPDQDELKCTRCNSRNIKKSFSTFNVGGRSEKRKDPTSSCPTGTCAFKWKEEMIL